MSVKPELEKLLRDNARIWRGRGGAGAGPETLSTGHRDLDEALPGGGWPVGALTEISVSHWGSGELRLLLPVLAVMAQTRRWLVFIAPPYIPYAPALMQAGIDLRYTLLIDLEGSHPDVLWSMEKLLRNPHAGIVMAWPQAFAAGQLRRLQLAAEAGRSLGFLFQNKMTENSPAALRLQLNPAPQGLEVRIVKARGSIRRQTLFLPL